MTDLSLRTRSCFTHSISVPTAGPTATPASYLPCAASPSVTLEQEIDDSLRERLIQVNQRDEELDGSLDSIAAGDGNPDVTVVLMLLKAFRDFAPSPRTSTTKFACRLS